MHTQPGIKEKLVEDLKAAVKLIMTQDDRQLGKKVNFPKLFALKLFFQKISSKTLFILNSKNNELKFIQKGPNLLQQSNSTRHEYNIRYYLLIFGCML